MGLEGMEAWWPGAGGWILEFLNVSGRFFDAFSCVFFSAPDERKNTTQTKQDTTNATQYTETERKTQGKQKNID